MNKPDFQRIIDVLEPFVSKHKQGLIDKVLAARTRHITLVFEDIDKPHNVSAVLRTAECMGIQDLHFIRNRNTYTVNQHITQGAAKWVSLNHHTGSEDNVMQCYRELRAKGYAIYASSLADDAHSIYDIDPSQKTAIVFGTEADGISEEARKEADNTVHIPMLGFTESYNLSVSAAICLTVLKGNSGSWPGLTDQEKLELKSEWYRKVVRESDKILKFNA